MPAQVLGFLQERSMDVLVAGDSMMRQLFIRLVHMMRGVKRPLDYHIHTHASYAVSLRSRLRCDCSVLKPRESPAALECFSKNTLREWTVH